MNLHSCYNSDLFYIPTPAMSEIHVSLITGMETQLHTVSGGGKTEEEFFRELHSSKHGISSFDTEKNFRTIQDKAELDLLKEIWYRF